MIKQKQASIEIYDEVTFQGKNGKVLGINLDKALIHCPDLDALKPYIVCDLKDLVKLEGANHVN